MLPYSLAKKNTAFSGFGFRRPKLPTAEYGRGSFHNEIFN